MIDGGLFLKHLSTEADMKQKIIKLVDGVAAAAHIKISRPKNKWHFESKYDEFSVD